MDSDSSGWHPPSEAEQKVMQARRDRADKISKIMGDYLLKGWKMLDSYCDDCGTILLQDKHGNTYCIACNELRSDTDKDNPAINVVAAESQVKEHQRTTGGKITTTAIVSNGPVCSRLDSDSSDDFPTPMASSSAPLPRKETTFSMTKERPKRTTASHETSGSLATTSSQLTLPQMKNVTVSDVMINVDDTQDVLIQKLQWATDQLKLTTSIELCTQLCQLIKAAAEALHAIKQLNT